MSGQGHERFRSIIDAHGNTPSDELARRLFGTGQVARVHVYANIITVDLEKGYDSVGLSEPVRDLYMYWKPGVQPPSVEDLQPDQAEVASSDVVDTSGVELSAEAKKVPPHLLERGRAARTKWNSR